MSNQTWETLSSKILYTSPWLTVRLDDVQLPSGNTVHEYSIVELPHVAVVVAITKSNNVILVKQYRHAIQQVLIELPAGTYNPQKETAKVAALRELQEETGYKAADLVQLGKLYEYPTKQTHTVTLFLATDVMYEPSKNVQIDETENIEIVEVPFEQAIALVHEGKICVGGSATALLLARDYLASLR